MSRLQKLLKIAATPAYWRPLAMGVAATAEHAPALRHFEFNTILDVGANKGQFAAFAQHAWPHARLVCFEPMADAAEKLARVTRGRARIVHAAASAECGKALLHIASRADSSSLLPLGDLQKSEFAMTEARTIEISTLTLEAVIPSAELRAPTLLKIDVQGAELQVLHGAATILESIDAIYVECSFQTLYEGQCSASDICEFLLARNFDLRGVFNQTLSRQGRPLQADFLFERRLRR